MTYKVAANYTQHITKTVEANSEEEALQLVDKYLDEHGTDSTFIVFDREYDVVQAESTTNA